MQAAGFLRGPARAARLCCASGGGGDKARGSDVRVSVLPVGKAVQTGPYGLSDRLAPRLSLLCYKPCRFPLLFLPCMLIFTLFFHGTGHLLSSGELKVIIIRNRGGGLISKIENRKSKIENRKLHLFFAKPPLYLICFIILVIGKSR